MEKIRIPLPIVSRGSNCRAHPFPIKISIQTMEFIQTSIFYNSLVDLMTGEYLRISNSMEDIKQIMIQDGSSQKEWNKNFSYFEKYKEIYQRQVFQNVLISIRSHWDWYIRKIGEFVIFARGHVCSASLSRKKNDKLKRLAFLSIQDQLEVLQEACDIKINIDSKDINLLVEMSLVRNLGLHNRWEVDQYYVNKSEYCNWSEGELRLFDSLELFEWHKSLIKAVKNSGLAVAECFTDVPDY